MKQAFTSSDVDIVQHKTLHDGFFKIDEYQCRFKQFDGSWSKTITREIFERGRSVAVLLYDPKIDHVVLIQQFRVGALRDPNSPWLLEIVAGMLDEPNNAPEQTAKRETKEETNLDIEALELIHEFWVSPGGSSEFISLYLGIVDATQAGGVFGNAHDSEDIFVFTVPVSEAFQMLREKKLNNAIILIALQWLALNHDRVRTL